jgi:hypothetical protein
MIAEVFGTVAFSDVPLVEYRRHGDNASTSPARSHRRSQTALSAVR